MRVEMTEVYRDWINGLKDRVGRRDRRFNRITPCEAAEDGESGLVW